MTALSSTLPSPLVTRPASPQLLDPRQISSPDQIATQLALLAKREAEVTQALNTLISDRSSIDGALARLQQVSRRVESLTFEVDGSARRGSLGFVDGPRRNGSFGLVDGSGRHGSLGMVDGEGSEMGRALIDEDVGMLERVRRVWETSERVGGKVRRLDEEVGRVREATEIVTEVLELKTSLQTLTVSMAKKDWESASRACRRAMDVRPEVINGGFAGAVVPTPSQPQPPPQLLEELRESLLRTFRTEFEAAAERKDEQAVSRFFRLWPGVGAEEEGLEAYGDFVVGLVKARSSSAGKPSNPLYYLTSLTSLLESIAHIIDQHQPVVDKYYGKGRMRTVVGRLVGESDRVVRNLVEGWEEERRVGRLISDTKQSRFPLLNNPQLLPPLFPSLQNPSTNQLSLSSIANTTSSHLQNFPAASNLLNTYTSGSKRPASSGGLATPTLQEEEQSGPDPKDVDRVLGELVALGGRWALFRRFVWGRLEDEEDSEDVQLNGHNGDPEEPSDPSPLSTPLKSNEMEIVERSQSQRAIQNLLRVYYEPLELWFLRTSIEKAHRLDNPETSSKPHLSAILDDTFYLLKLVINRVLSCGSLSTLNSMRREISTVVENDYAGVIKRKMEGVYAAQSGAGPEKGFERDRREKEQRQAFVIYSNDLDVSADYTERLIEETLMSLPQVFLETELQLVREELGLLGSLANRFRSICKAGLEQLFNQLTRPRLRVILDDCYRDVTYLLDEDGFAVADEDDLVRERFVRAWEGLIDGYRDSFTDNNYQTFFNMTIEILVRPWEKMIMSMKFTELGAIRFERDVRGVVNYLSSQTSFGGAREKFVRLQQIATVLNMDADEDPEEFYSNAGIPWRISKGEYKNVVEQRR